MYPNIRISMEGTRPLRMYCTSKMQGLSETFPASMLALCPTNMEADRRVLDDCSVGKRVLLLRVDVQPSIFFVSPHCWQRGKQAAHLGDQRRN